MSGDTAVNGWQNNPHYEIEFDLIPATVCALVRETTIAKSDSARVMFELGHTPVYYFPREDVYFEHLLATEHRTYCPYKGYANYWSIALDDGVVENAIWAYAEPHAEMACVAGYLGFYWGKMDAWYEDGTRVEGPREIPGRIDTHTQFKRQFPGLAAQWHPQKNIGISPYEFSTFSDTVVWWLRDDREWQESIRARVLEATTLRADGDAHPYD